MKIVDIQAVSVDLPPAKHKTPARRQSWREVSPIGLPLNKYPDFPPGLPRNTPGIGGRPVWVKVTAEDGTWGLGRTSFGEPVAALVDRFYAPLLVGRDCFATELLNDVMWRASKRHGSLGLNVFRFHRQARHRPLAEPSKGTNAPARHSDWKRPSMTVAKQTQKKCRYWRNLGLFALLASFAGYLFIQYVGHPFYLSYGWSHPKRLDVCCVTPADRNLDYRDVSFETGDGLTLRGWYVPSRNRAAVILSHPLAGNRIAVLDVAEVLARNGYGVLLLDLRAHGASEGESLPFGGNEAQDVRAAAVYVQTCPDVDPSRIGAMGLSLGAQVSILAAAGTDAIQAVVADGPCCTTFEDWPPPESVRDWLYKPYDLVFHEMLRWRTGVSAPLSVQEAIARIAPRPILLIGGESERNLVEHHYAAAGEPKELWIIPGAGHIDGLRVAPKAYEERIVHFFDQALLSENQ